MLSTRSNGGDGPMIRFVVKRLGGGIVQLIAVTFLTWLLFYVIASLTGASPALRRFCSRPKNLLE